MSRIGPAQKAAVTKNMSELRGGQAPAQYVRSNHAVVTLVGGPVAIQKGAE